MARRTAIVGERSGNLLVPRSGLEKAGGPSRGIRCGNKCTRFVRAAEHVFRTGAKIRAYEIERSDASAVQLSANKTQLSSSKCALKNSNVSAARL